MSEDTSNAGASPSLRATLHTWTPGPDAPYPTEDNQVGDQVGIGIGGWVTFPEVANDGMYFAAIWNGDELAWRSEVTLIRAPGKLTVSLVGLKIQSPA